MKIMASGPITSWAIYGETVETVSDFIYLGSKVTADGDCSHEIKRRLLLGRKVMTNLDSILRSRDITLPTKVCLVKAMCWEPAWGAPPVAKVMREEAQHTQRQDLASGVPLEILEHLPPKPESAYFTLCALTYTSDLRGPVPHHHLSLWKRVNLQLLLIKFQGVTRVFQPTSPLKVL